MKIAYLYLGLTILFDSIGIALLNKAAGVSKLTYLLAGLLGINLGLLFLSLALESMAMTVANATFAGVSSLLVALIGYWYFGERYTVFQYVCVAAIIFGVIGLNSTGVTK